MKTVFKSLHSIILLIMLMLLMPLLSFAADTIRVNIPRVTVTMARSSNILNLPAKVVEKTGATAAAGAVKAEYLYSADGIKQRVVDGAGSNGYLYLGTLVLSKSGESYTLSSTGFGGGRIIGGAGNICLAYYYGTDHLGSVRVITDGSGSVVERNDYYPLGMRTATGNSYLQLAANLYKYNGKELQTVGGLGFTDYGARMYDDFTGRWFVPDPLAEKYASMSPYMYCGGNPISMVDVDGMEVKSVFNKGTNKLYILDLDHYQKGLPMKYVSAGDYQLKGIRDKNGNLTHNQVLVINNVFSGWQVENGKIVRNANDNRQKTIPNAIYDIVDNNADTRHTGWFRIDRQDNSRYNDKDDVTGRNGYRFHLGGLSWGCITVDITQEDAQATWNVVTSIMNSTSTTTVPEKRGKQWLNPFSRLTKYGTIEVIGDDKIPHKQKATE